MVKIDEKMKILIATLLLSALWGITNCSQRTKQQQKPNIIFILADDMGYGDIETFNPQCKINTPNLNTLSEEGMMFTDAHTSSSVCTPTRYGLLTGRYNWRSRLKSGVLNGVSTALIPESRTTVASLLKKEGYNTGFIGKWHLGWSWGLKDNIHTSTGNTFPIKMDDIDYGKPIAHTPNDLGFDYSCAIPASLDMPPYVYVINRRVTSPPATVTGSKEKYSWWRKGPTGADFHHIEVTPKFFDNAISYIKESANRGQPFFLYLALPSPHTPILPTAQWQGKSGLNPYGDFVMMVDYYVGKLLAAVTAAGIEDNTLVIFTSDNGCSPQADFELLKEKGHNPSYIYRGYKADIYEGGHRVPFIAKWPKVIMRGSVSDETICTTDLFATCAEISGYHLSDNEGEDSYSLLPLFKRRVLGRSFREATIHSSINGSFAIRKGDYKLIMCPGSGGWSYPRPHDKIISSLPKVQLYNLRLDPRESNNLQAENPDKIAELKSLLEKYITEGRSTPGAPQANDAVNFKWEQIDFTK